MFNDIKLLLLQYVIYHVSFTCFKLHSEDPYTALIHSQKIIIRKPCFWICHLLDWYFSIRFFSYIRDEKKKSYQSLK